MSNARVNTQRGGALLAVLWLSAGLAAIAFSVSSSVRAETDRVSTAADGLRTWYLATGAVERGIQWMMWGGDYRRPDGSPQFWERNQPRLYMSFPSGEAVVEMIPESAKLNINTAGGDRIYAVVMAVTGDEERASEITAAILDWRSASATPSLFDSYYGGISPTFRARHASFEEIEELLLVRGMTSELFYGNYVPDSTGRLVAHSGLRDSLSVWGSLGPFDVNSASPALMQAVGVPLEGVVQIIERRKTRPFGSMGDVIAMGIPAPSLSVGGNTIWSLRATARLKRPDGSPSEVVRSAGAVVKTLDPRKNPVTARVLRWYDDAWSQDAIAPFSGMPVGAASSAPAGPLVLK